MGRRVDPSVKAQAIRMRENGASFGAIAHALGVSKGTLSYWFTPGLRERQQARGRERYARNAAARKPRAPREAKAKPKPRARAEPKPPPSPRRAADVSPILAMRIEDRVRRRLEGS